VSSVQVLLSLGAGLPAAVDPEPLFRILADRGLEGCCEEGGVGEGVGCGVGGAGEGELGAEVEYVTLLAGLPDHEAGEDGGVGVLGDAGEAGGGAGGDSEEGHEDALGRRHIGVHEDADGLAVVHGLEEAAGEVVLGEDAVAVEAADAIDEGVDERVVEAADDHAHGVAHERVEEAGQFPSAEVAGEDEDAVAFGAGGEVVIEALVAEEFFGVLAGGAGHAAELGQLPAEGAEEGAEDAGALGEGFFREGEGEVAQADAAEAGEQMPGEAADGGAGGSGERAGKQAEEGEEQAESGVFQPFAEGGVLRRRGLGIVSQRSQVYANQLREAGRWLRRRRRLETRALRWTELRVSPLRGT